MSLFRGFVFFAGTQPCVVDLVEQRNPLPAVYQAIYKALTAVLELEPFNT